MSTSNLRVIAAGVAAIVAVLTGVVAGWVGAQTATTCTSQATTARPSATTHAPNQGKPLSPTGGQGDDGTHDLGPGSGEQADTGPTAAPPAAEADCQPADFSVQTAAVGFVGAALAGGLALVLLLAGRRRTDTGTAAAPVSPGPPDGGAGAGLGARAEAAETERATLIKTCVYVRDRATSKAISDHLGRALAEVGVTTVEPVGVRFDPAHHEAGGATGTTEAARAGTIAAVEVPGYVDRGTVLRAPVVTVYREEPTP